MRPRINRLVLLNFVLNNVSEIQHKRILKRIENNKAIRELYHEIKREIDVQRYADDEMSSEERIEFEKKMEEDPELKANYNLYKDVDGFLREFFNQNKWQ